ncbi:MAG: TonB-dependent receptor [Prolixibacteraceae bacterium]|nr:TonB-dependent receptor [Prolixibacteraceae bacterium]
MKNRIQVILFFFLLPFSLIAQEVTVRGRVIHAVDRLPLPGVSVFVKATTKGVITDLNGNYVLSGVSSNATLVFTFVGMKRFETSVSGKTVIDVSLEEETVGIEEVIAIGYGTVKKSDLTGAVGNVEVKSMAKAPVGSFTEALAGRVAGLQVSAYSGQPGEDMNILIRGTGSLTQSTSPLFVVDGFPVENLDPSTLNLEEIETMTVLKDASSTAIYGSRAANGVILIKTKRGMVSKPVITFNASLGIQNNWKKMDLMEPYEFVKYISELHPTQQYVKNYFLNDKTLEDYRDVEGINVADLVFRTGAVNIYNLSIRGGNEETKYSISGSIYDQEGIIINTGLKRYNGRVTLDQDLSPKLKTGLTANYSGVKSYGQSVSSFSSANSVSSTALFRTWVYRPVTPDLSPDLLYEDVDEDAIYAGDIRINPFVDLENQHQLTDQGLLEANGYINYEILKGLNFKITGGIRRQVTQTERFYNSKTAQGNPLNPNNLNGIWGTLSTANANAWMNEYILTYNKTFANDHVLTGLGLFSLNKYTSDSNGFSSKMLPNESLGIAGMNEGVAFDPVSATSESTLSSYATRWDYSYKSKYLFSATFRADGSSKFSDKNKWGYFPGVSAAWNMEQEDFFKTAFPFISNSKLRVSYGSNGNNRVGDFARFAQLTQSLDGYSYNNQTPTGAVYVSAMANDDLKWEKTTKIDIGYEIGFFEKRINMEIDLYRNTTTDLLLNSPLPPTTGFSSTIKNIGSLKNEGLEITINTVNVQNRSFRWTSNFNISFNKNKIIELTRGQQNLTYVAKYESQYSTPLYISEIGNPIGMMYGYVWDGNYQYDDFDNPSPGVYLLKNSVTTNGMARESIQPGDIKYKDLNGDLVVNTYDKTIIGRGQPIHIGGFLNNLVYKQFSLNIFLQWSYGNHIYNANRLALEGNSNGRLNMNQFASYIDRWSPDNQTNKNFRSGGPGPVGYHSSRVVEDGSFLRLKTVSLEYSLPRQICSKLFMRDLTLNVSAQNLYTLTNYSGLDPEVSVSGNKTLGPGFDFSAYPQPQTIVFGVKATF